jgi:iron complex transport system substrate-binding protein
MVKQIFILLFLALACLTMQCHVPANQKKNEKQITDTEGNRVVLPDSVSTVCTFGNSLNQLLLTLGAGSRLSATTSIIQTNSWVGKVFPGVSQIPAWSKGETDISLEELLQHRPDVFISWHDNQLCRKVRDLKIPVVIVNYSTPDEFKSAARLLGEILGKPSVRQANQLIQFYDSIQSAVDQCLMSLSDKDRKRVYYSVSNPLTTEGLHSIVTTWIKLSGGINVSAQAGIEPIRTNITDEKLLAMNPDIIVVSDSAVYREFFADSRWTRLKAVKQQKVWVSPRGINTWATRSSENILQSSWLAKQMYPEKCAAIDPEKATVRFYSEFYKHALSHDELRYIFAGVNP